MTVDQRPKKPHQLDWSEANDGRSFVLRASPVAKLWSAAIVLLAALCLYFCFFPYGLLSVSPLIVVSLYIHRRAIHLRFSAGIFVHEKTSLGIRQAHKAIPILEIVEFVETTGRSGREVRARLTSGQSYTVPLPLPVGPNGVFDITERCSHARYIAECLNEALDRAKHEGGSYRVAPGIEGLQEEPEIERHLEAAKRR
jgi:hypothetical protein